MGKKISRREFLKLSTAVSAGLVFGRARPMITPYLGANAAKPNIIIFVFDAMTARNLSVYGYPRKTTPNFEKFAQRAIVYHRHYAGGSYTTPGTASLLTGLYPWTHRALTSSSAVRRDLARNNIFAALKSAYYRAGFAQNYWANVFLYQFSEDIERYISPASWSLLGPTLGASVAEHVKDKNIAYQAYVQVLFERDRPRSLGLGFLDHLMLQYFMQRNVPASYPRGVPEMRDHYVSYINEMVFDGLAETVRELSYHSPYFAYFHLWSPHDPYRARKDFIGLFNGDSFKPPEKPIHPLGENLKQMNSPRRNYDEYLANVDAEFGRLMEMLESEGVLENTCVIIASDHGESFERGDVGHFSPLLYEAVIRTPLLIRLPGQQQRHDVDVPTSNVDILPTVARIADVDSRCSSDGSLLPGIGGAEDAERDLFVMDAKSNSSFGPLNKITLALIRGDYKLIHYRGYSGDYDSAYEFYDLRNDPEELNNLYKDSKYTGVVADMRATLLEELDAKNRLYQTG